MRTSGFDLVVHKLPLPSSAERANVSDLLSREFKTDIIEIESSLEQAPYVFKHGSTVAELLPEMIALVGVGAVAVIVPRNTTLTKTEDGSRRDSITTNFHAFYKKYSSGLSQIMQDLNVEPVCDLLHTLLQARSDGQRIFFIGNGGSASIASHATTDFAKDRFPDERYLFKVMSLTDNTSLITATANDFGYENIFVKQLKCLLQKDDVVVAISSSGNSKNIINAVEYAKQNGAHTVGIVGFDGGKLATVAQQYIHIPTKIGQYGFVEDVSMILVHMLSVFIYENDRSDLR